MPTYTIFGNTTDNSVAAADVTYLTMRSGAGVGAAGNSGLAIKTVTNTSEPVANSFFAAYKSDPAYYYATEVMIAWDTSSIPTTDTVTAVALSLFGPGGKSGGNFTVEVYPKDWGSAVDTGDWVAGASIGALGLLASFAVGASAVNWANAYNAFTENGTAFRTAIVKGGTTKVLLCLDTLRSTTAPVATNDASVYLSDQGGTTNDPKLVITTVTAGNFFSFF